MRLVSTMRTAGVLAIGLVLLPAIANAATEYATFESFYHQSSKIGWAIAAVAAIAILATILLTGGTASPIVVTLGTWVGGLMGLSGIAATNAGLALLGGGSIAVGGFGIVGGTALLTAALTFGTDIVLDYTAGKALDTYEYSRFVDISKNMVTLPLPKNSGGPKSYEAAFKVLEKANVEDGLYSNHNQSIIREAIQAIGLGDKKDLAETARSRVETLLALLYFTGNDYVAAKWHASLAYQSARKADIKATLPAFLYATSALYDTNLDFNLATDFFNYAIMNEPDNPISPLLFVIYLDRMMYRFNDGRLSSKTLDKVYTLSQALPYDERKAAIQMGILSRYFMRIKLEQQKILSLARSANQAIKDSPKTLLRTRDALTEYELLLASSRAAISQQSATLELRLGSSPSVTDRLMGKGIEEWETQWNGKVGEMRALWSNYSDGVAGLEALVRELDTYQTELARVRQAEGKAEAAPQATGAIDTSDWGLWPYLFSLVMVVLLGAFLFRKRPAEE